MRPFCNTVLQYQTHMEGVVDGRKNVCGCCGLFATHNISTVYSISHPLIQDSLASGLIMLSEVDCCATSEDSLHLCQKYIRSLSHAERPKFGCGNGLPKIYYQSYPAALEGLSIAKEAAIARAHPVVSILKLKPSGAFNPAAYNRIKGHAVLLPQNPAPLLNFLPSSSIELHDVICIVWAGDGQPSDYDLRHFIQVRKQKVIDALTCLPAYNPLYRNIINYTMLASMPDQFIPDGIVSRIVNIDQDHSKREGYGANLETNNDLNNLHHAIGSAGINDSGILSGCIYTDVNESRQNPYLRLISATRGACLNNISKTNHSRLFRTKSRRLK